MKFIIVLFWLFLSTVCRSQLNLSMPECRVIYRGYANKFVINDNCYDSIQLVTKDGQLIKSNFTTHGFDYSGYILYTQGRLVELITKGYLNSKIITSDTTIYTVKPFPSPKLLIHEISQLAGCRLIVSLGSDSYISGCTFSINGGEVLTRDGFQFQGPIIPGIAVKNVAIGKSVGVTLSVTNNITGSTDLISGSLLVQP